jgi:hypothetical protein
MIGWRNCFRRQGTWRRIFVRSAVNGATYRGEQLPTLLGLAKEHLFAASIEIPQATFISGVRGELRQDAHVEPVSSRVNAQSSILLPWPKGFRNENQ